MAVNNNAIREYFDAPPGLQNAIRTLRTNIKFAAVDREIKTLVVTSTQQDEGKTTVSLFLGIALAESGCKTVIVNADCYKPILSHRFGRRCAKSWLDLLYGKISPLEASVVTDQKGLYYLDCEPDLTAPVELIGSNRFAAMTEVLKENFDYVIFDTPPLGSFIEAALLASKADGTIVVVSAGEVDRAKAAEVIDQLRKANAKIIGAVLNKVNANQNNYTGLHYTKTGKKKETKTLKETSFVHSANRSYGEFL